MTHEDDAQGARERRWLLFWLAAFWAMIISILFPPAPRLIWNFSPSMPVGLYRVYPGALPERGATVIAWTPKPYRGLAAERRYLPENVPLVKRVAGMPGDRICAAATAITLNGAQVATRLKADAAGRPMPWWQGCRTLAKGEYFLLLADVPASFDGRYFGITRRADIIGLAHLLWSR
jgi:conjugative transfer signal peptidase TraF